MAQKSTVTKTEQLRQFVQQAERVRIDLVEIADRAGIGYQRLRRIVKYGSEPTLEEAAQISAAIEDLAIERAVELQRLASV